MSNDTTVVYHSNCYDGFGAAWTMHEYMKITKPDVNVLYIPASYELGPHVRIPDGTNVCMVDFSMSREELLALAGRSSHLTILDHHASAQRNLVGLEKEADNIYVEFDMDRSGAIITWDHYFGPENRPTLLKYIQDSDLWHFDMEDSQEVRSALRSYPMDFTVWSRLMVRWQDLIAEGRAILHFQNTQVEMICRNSWIMDFFGVASVPVTNTSCFWSEVGHELLRRYPSAPFVGAYTDMGGTTRKWSLRSEDSRWDVSKVAEQFGGGGHRNAAGFSHPLQ